MKEGITVIPTDIKKTTRKYYDQNHIKNFTNIKKMNKYLKNTT